MKWNKTALALTGALALMANAAMAQGFFTNGLPLAGGSQYPTTIPLTGNERLPADTMLPSGLNPASEAITSAQLSVFGLTGLPRNLLANGAMQVAQQLTGTIISCGTNTAPIATSFAADRWFCDANVAVGAGRTVVATSGAPIPPPVGFNSTVQLYRNSGALTQQVCLMQAVQTSSAVALQGKSVMFSAYLRDLGALSSVNDQVNMYLITGTGTDEGFGTLTASPAITPAWTGLLGGTTANSTFSTTTTFARFNSGAIAVPATATEVGVLMCFTPVGSSSGTTDGFSMTGAQLEIVPSGATTPSAFENHLYQQDFAAATRYFWQLNEPASGAAIAGFCGATTTTAVTCTLNLPTPMRGTTPVFQASVPGTFKVVVSGVATTLSAQSAGVCSLNACALSGTVPGTTAGFAFMLQGGGGTGVWIAHSDKVL